MGTINGMTFRAPPCIFLESNISISISRALLGVKVRGKDILTYSVHTKHNLIPRFIVQRPA